MFHSRKIPDVCAPGALMAGLYAAVHGYAHHHGTMFVAAIAELRIAWPTAQEKSAFNQRDGGRCIG